MSKPIPKWIKDKKYHFCAICGAEDDLQYHHWIPESLGGKTEFENIMVVCATCHQKRHDQKCSDHHNYLVKNGIAKARERGVKVGKKPADYEKVMRLIAENSTQFNRYSEVTEHEIMEMAGVKSVCYAKCKRMLLEAINSDEWPYAWKKPVEVFSRPIYEHKLKRLRGDAI